MNSFKMSPELRQRVNDLMTKFPTFPLVALLADFATEVGMFVGDKMMDDVCKKVSETLAIMLQHKKESIRHARIAALNSKGES